MDQPLVSVIIPCFNKWQYTFTCLMRLLENTKGVSYETIVVDNASSDDTKDGLPQLEGLRLQRNEENLGFARACNQGARLAKGRYLLFLNNDTEPLPNWLPPMVKLLDTLPDVHVVGSKLLFPDGTLQHAGVAVAYAAPLPISPFHVQYRQPAGASTKMLEANVVTAACLMIRSEVFEAVGGFDEGYVNGYEDVDLCLKVRERGGRILYTPESVLVHHESVSDGRFHHTTPNTILLNKRWMGRFTDFDVDGWSSQWVNPPDAARPPITSVVVVKESLLGIAPTLESLWLNMGPQDDIIVVDTGSTDGTLDFVKLFSEKRPGAVSVLAVQAESNIALEQGLSKAKGKYGVAVEVGAAIEPGAFDALVERCAAGASLATGDVGLVMGLPATVAALSKKARKGEASLQKWVEAEGIRIDGTVKEAQVARRKATQAQGQAGAAP